MVEIKPKFDLYEPQGEHSEEEREASKLDMPELDTEVTREEAVAAELAIEETPEIVGIDATGGQQADVEVIIAENQQLLEDYLSAETKAVKKLEDHPEELMELVLGE